MNSSVSQVTVTVYEGHFLETCLISDENKGHNLVGLFQILGQGTIVY